ncbi:PDGLE domain-containing protein [Mycobacterium sp. CVI_P3]|uniref:PDGLE domain-containing protein n=1 Tax=Mycobacterium pinniadriaticum TaxID=2994102 RepID=A0ABT3SBU8_9MYCO|nr:PDGLE domain-containing protein [Mycobacterium pinniadriaticum]MCX2930572.1 PDGLE domain-containing protein [Mycobacterium pinniadriaticum]MCX2936996.1 PDGLE domain-containing protein [Mycobacterium pinniadriaticum]
MSPRRWQFWVGFGVSILLIAGVVSYFASSNPDGLDSATRQGCHVIDTANGEQLSGNCIAQHATQHAMSASPLADYTVLGHPASGGLAGIIGAAIVLAIAGGAFWLISRTRRAKG